MDECILINPSFFNKIKLKKQKQKELENLCDQSIKLIENTKDDMLIYFKLSNGVNTDENKKSKKNIFQNYKNFKLNLNSTSSLNNSKRFKDNILSTKRSTNFYITKLDEEKETEEDVKQNKTKEVIFKLPTINSISTHKSPISKTPIKEKLNTQLSAIKEMTITEEITSPNAKRVRGNTKKLSKIAFTKQNSPVRFTEPDTFTPIGSPRFITKTEAGANKKFSDKKKFPRKRRFSNIYNEFESISKNNIQLTTSIEQSNHDYSHNMYRLKNKEHLDQNKLFDDVHREKLFIMEDTNKKADPFVQRLDKYEVLKEFNLINVIRDECAVEVMKKYMKHEQRTIETQGVRVKNHKRILKILDEMQYINNI
jgi:hypothetical protein